ncbi:MAG: hypothetical protein WC201_03140, partial [Bacilli bacterium]
PLLSICLTSCGFNYHMNAFFDDEVIKENEVDHLPSPTGEMLYIEEHGFVDPYVYVDDNRTSFDAYASVVLHYLQTLDFAFLGTAGDVKMTIGVIPAIEPSYYFNEASTLEDFYQSEEPSYYFVYSHGGIKTNDDDEEYISNVHCLKMSFRENSQIQYDNDKSNYIYNYYIKFFILASFFIDN